MKKKKEVVFHDIWSILCCQFVFFQGKGKEIPRQNIDSNDLKEPHIFFLENIFNILVIDSIWIINNTLFLKVKTYS